MGAHRSRGRHQPDLVGQGGCSALRGRRWHRTAALSPRFGTGRRPLNVPESAPPTIISSAPPPEPTTEVKGSIDNPSGEVAWGRSLVRGWAVYGGSPAPRVEALVDGRVIGSGSTGLDRPDVAQALGSNAFATAGYAFMIDVPRLDREALTLTVRVTDASGLWATLGSVPLRQIAPAIEGRIDIPTEEDPVPADGIIIRGWGVAAGVPNESVEIFVDGTSAGLARIGLPRDDLIGYLDAPHAGLGGFEFVVDPATLEQGRTSVRLSAEIRADGCTPLRFPDRVVRLKPAKVPDAADRERLALVRERTGQRLTAVPAVRTEGLDLLTVTHDLGYGGGQLWLSELLDKMGAGRDFPCTVVAPKDGPLRKDLEALGIHVHVVHDYPVADVEAYEGRIGELALWTRTASHNAVLVNTFGAFIGADLAARLRLPCIWGIHESWTPDMFWTAAYGPGAAHPTVRESAMRALGATSAVVFEAEATRQLYLPHTRPGAAVVVPYGIDTALISDYLARVDKAQARRDLGLAQDGRIVLVMGTVEPRKAQALITCAFADVAGENPDARLVMVGGQKIPYREQVEQLIDDLGLTGRAEVVPIVSDTSPWYRAADVLLTASDIESLPRSVLDAMCFGLPVAATSVFGLPELLTDGDTGYLFETKHFSTLRDAVRRILVASDDELARVGEAGRQHVLGHHDSQGYARDVHALLKDFRAGTGTSAEEILAPLPG